MIAELLLEAFVTGGVAAVAKITQFLGKLGSKTFQAAAKAGRKADDALSAVATRLSAFFQSLKDGTAVKQLQQWIDDIVAEIKRMLGVVDDVDGSKIVPNKKRLQQYDDFVKKWKGKSIKSLTKTEIANALRGFTEQGNKVAKLIEEGGMKFKILDDAEFNKMLVQSGDTLDVAKATAAFNIGDKNYFRSSKPVQEFLSELIHEGTHTLDNRIVKEMIDSGVSDADIIKRMGNNHSYEKRAYFHERAWQEATGMDKDFDTIDDMLEHIRRHYDEY